MSGGNNGILAPQTFELLSPSRFITFTFPNPNHRINSNNNNHLCSPYYSLPLLRIAVLDSPSPSPPSSSPSVAAMLVPIGREHDWIFSSFDGHLHLLLSSSPSFSRLILIGDVPSEPKPYSLSDPDPDPIRLFESSLLPLLLALSPKYSFDSGGVPEIPFLSYHDGVVRILPVNRLVGPAAGEMLVEDVELAGGELRRRLRFKRMPNLVQSQVLLTRKYRPEAASLVQPYLGPMVAALSLLAPDLGPKTRALCLGVGGGALLMCLRHRCGFNVIGVEADEVVLCAAKLHFGLIEDEFLKVVVGDGIELMESRNEEMFLDGFDVIMVDLDSGDVLNGISAPPLEFLTKNVLLSARSALREKGIMVINVIPSNVSFYKRLVDSLRVVFAEIYEIEVGNGDNFVLITAVSPVGSVGSKRKGGFLRRMKKVGVDRFVDSIKKV